MSTTTLVNKLQRYIDIEPDNECWLWTGCLSHGRGHVRWDGKMRVATRAIAVAYEMKDPDDVVFTFTSKYLLLHECNNPRCVNPDHLYVGTNSDNMHDRQRAGRAPDMRGEKHPQCKISKEDVVKIRCLLKEGIPQRKIAKQFGVLSILVSQGETKNDRG